MSPSTRSTFSTTHRMGIGILCSSPDSRSDAEPTSPPRLTPYYVLVLYVAKLSYSSTTFHMDFPNLTTWKEYIDMLTLFSKNLCIRSGTPCKLSTFPRHKLNIMDEHTKRNILYRHTIPDLRLYLLTRYNL